nr:periphilin-1 isoform X9 [Pogona vitticeps]
MAYRSNEMWSDERYDCERLPRERLPPRPDDDYHRVVNFPPKKTPLPERPAEGRYSRYEYSHAPVGYRDYGEGRGFERRSGPPHRIDDPGYRWPRDDHPPSRQLDYRDVRDSMRRKPIFPHYDRDRSPHKRDSPYFRESPISRRESPHSRSGSSVSSRSYSPERSKAYAFHQSQHSRNKERTVSQPLKTSRDVSPSGTTPSKALDKSSRLSEKELAEAAGSRWAADKVEKADTSTVPEISEYDAAAPEPLYVEPHEETGADVTGNNELFEEAQHVTRTKAIAAKTKEIEQVYRQDCETFGAVVKMLIEKDPSLEKPIQFSLRQNLHEIGERCIEELKHFIAEYDTANQEFEEP